MSMSEGVALFRKPMAWPRRLGALFHLALAWKR
jgi:hypothetical protein